MTASRIRRAGRLCWNVALGWALILGYAGFVVGDWVRRKLSR